jgi:hypothetical protein
METLLIVAIVLIALAVVTQAGVLVAMYLMSRRIGEKAERLMDDSRKFIAPMESITANLKVISDDLAETGKIARNQALHIQEFVSETHQAVHEQIADVRTTVQSTMNEARRFAMRPVREYSAVAMGIMAGLRTFFRRRPKPSESPFQAEPPAA